jgi:hypothetical protein
MNTVSRIAAAKPRERPVILVNRLKVSRLMISKMFLRVKVFVFWVLQ